MKTTAAFAFAISTALAAPAVAQDIVDVAVGADDFNTLVAAVQAAGLVDALKGDGPFTVFAPTDAAFAALPEGTVEALLRPENRDDLIAILTYHVVPGEIMAADIVGETYAATTLQGSPLVLDGEGGSVMVDGATVVAPNIAASNGVIHVIDAVILPN